eukprot:1663742-Amphidinium_carterae.2
MVELWCRPLDRHVKELSSPFCLGSIHCMVLNVDVCRQQISKWVSLRRIAIDCSWQHGHIESITPSKQISFLSFLCLVRSAVMLVGADFGPLEIQSTVLDSPIEAIVPQRSHFGS